MSNLKEYKFSDLYTMSSGISSKPEQAGHGFPFVSFSTVFNNFFLPETLPDLMNTSAKEQEKYSIKKGDILLTRTSETIDELGMSCVALRDYPTATYSGFVKRLRPTQNDITYDKYMAFYLRSKFFRKTMTNNAFITLRASLNEAIFSYINLYLPDYQTQKKIGDFLHLLNVKIELNARINTELESMAKTFFRYQFVENKEKGSWEIGTLGDVAENIRRSANPNEIKPETHYIGLEHMPRKSIALAEYGNASELESNKYAFKTGEFLFGKLRPYFHKVGIAPVEGVCSTDILVIAPKSPEWYGFVLGHISSDEIIKYADATSGGTKMPRTNWESLAKFEISLPPVETAKKFSDFFTPIAKQIRTNILESQTLAELRDWLLPMLMNGQVEVN